MNTKMILSAAVLTAIGTVAVASGPVSGDKVETRSAVAVQYAANDGTAHQLRIRTNEDKAQGTAIRTRAEDGTGDQLQTRTRTRENEDKAQGYASRDRSEGADKGGDSGHGEGGEGGKGGRD